MMATYLLCGQIEEAKLMLFNSFTFIFLFLPVTLLIFFLLNRNENHRIAVIWLILASLIFYGWWQPYYIGLLLVSTGFNYITGLIIGRRYQNKLVTPRRMLLLGVAVNLLLLAYFKYIDFLISSVNSIFDTSFNLQNIILPIAISFFTFNQIAYLVDTYKEETQESNFLNYCLFVVFFPYLISGPIVHHKEIATQFNQPIAYRLNHENLAVGFTIFALGLFKKVVFADSIALTANPIFHAVAQGVPLTFFEAWTGALAYSFQLYFDFSGYSDMAIGVARMFGIKLPLNFDSPYKSVNIIDFWRRWHITLSLFLRDYIYIPLGGSRKGQLRRHANLMITMLLGGLWHGAGWTFVVWGGLHGLYLVINHQWHALLQSLGKNPKATNWFTYSLGCLVTFVAVVVAWVFFRADNIETAIAMLKAMTGTNGVPLTSPFTIVPTAYKELLFLLTFVWLMPNTQQWMQQFNPALDSSSTQKLSNWQAYLWKRVQWQPNLMCGFLVGTLLFIYLKTTLAAPPSSFLYFNF
ncbi:MBOAT family O-acyltransferase [Leptothermofonsia sp. ETS-13]|uniref:MBOAT family O-acyltransferase n=1 Tax=Leptothermofonsia sp. ETS-13 TaxID=3035696 RepID=UPI003BA0AC73